MRPTPKHPRMGADRRRRSRSSLEPAIRGVVDRRRGARVARRGRRPRSWRSGAGSSTRKAGPCAREMRRGKARRRRRAALFFLAPGLFVIVVFFFLPIAASLLLSADGLRPLRARGPVERARRRPLELRARSFATRSSDRPEEHALLRPRRRARSRSPWRSRTALLVNARLARCKGFFRTTFFAPVVTTLVAVAVVFKYVYHPRFGLLNRGLTLIGLPAMDWLGDPRFALVAIVLLAVWKNFGFSMILFVAGLQGDPGDPLRGGAPRRGRTAGSSSGGSRCRCSRRRCSSSASRARSTTSSSSPSPTS